MTKIKGPNGLVFDFPEPLASALLKDRTAYAPVESSETLEKPKPADPKMTWAAYAVQEGIDVTNMTKNDIIAAVAAAEAEDPEPTEPEEPEQPAEGDNSGAGSGDDSGDETPAE